jgi:hypothetical protein
MAVTSAIAGLLAAASCRLKLPRSVSDLKNQRSREYRRACHELRQVPTPPDYCLYLHTPGNPLSLNNYYLYQLWCVEVDIYRLVSDQDIVRQRENVASCFTFDVYQLNSL